jgi:hypothetical protein
MTSKLRKYIAEQPHTPNGFRYKTPILVSDSKGDLSGHLEIFHFKDFRFVVSFVLIVVYEGQDWAVYKFCKTER